MESNKRKRPPKEEETVQNLNCMFWVTVDLGLHEPDPSPNAIRHWQRLRELLAGSELRMIFWLRTHQDWVKAAHVIAIIAWMAGMLYLPRLFVYHAEAPKGSDVSATFKIMERRLLKAIINPAMILVFLSGFILVYLTGDWQDGWWQAKFILVLGLAGLHGYFARCVRTFAEDANERPARFYRILNEVPTALMILIVVLAVVKPF
jgi:protoporphyrinogen IX oxidase